MSMMAPYSVIGWERLQKATQGIIMSCTCIHCRIVLASYPAFPQTGWVRGQDCMMNRKRVYCYYKQSVMLLTWLRSACMESMNACICFLPRIRGLKHHGQAVVLVVLGGLCFFLHECTFTVSLLATYEVIVMPQSLVNILCSLHVVIA